MLAVLSEREPAGTADACFLLQSRAARRPDCTALNLVSPGPRYQYHRPAATSPGPPGQGAYVFQLGLVSTGTWRGFGRVGQNISRMTSVQSCSNARLSSKFADLWAIGQIRLSGSQCLVVRAGIVLTFIHTTKCQGWGSAIIYHYLTMPLPSCVSTNRQLFQGVMELLGHRFYLSSALQAARDHDQHLPAERQFPPELASSPSSQNLG